MQSRNSLLYRLRQLIKQKSTNLLSLQYLDIYVTYLCTSFLQNHRTDYRSYNFSLSIYRRRSCFKTLSEPCSSPGKKASGLRDDDLPSRYLSHAVLHSDGAWPLLVPLGAERAEVEAADDRRHGFFQRFNSNPSLFDLYLT